MDLDKHWFDIPWFGTRRWWTSGRMSSPTSHLVVDGSNIATEGRSLPSLQQLDEAVRAVIRERDFDSLTVIVDATFAHRIDQSEREEFDAAVDAGEIIMPPAGVVGRGDAFILQVAEKANAAVLSNDSFQEFHGEHGWLFEEGRLLGGKPIEHIGWVFVDRSPVRGPASRRSVRESRGGRDTKKKKSNPKTSSKAATGPLPIPSSPPPGGRRSTDSKPPPQTSVKTDPRKTDPRKTDPRKTEGSGVDRRQQAKPTRRVNSDSNNSKKKSSRSRSEKQTNKSDRTPLEELNNAADFLRFISSYSIGDSLDAVVDRFASHGCYLLADNTVCYLPSRSMGDPPPKRARDIVSHNQSVTVRVVSLDSDRRGINVELIAVGPPSKNNASVQGKDTPNRSANADRSGEVYLTRSESHVATKKSAAKKAAKKPTKRAATATSSARVKKAAGKKATARKAAAKKAAPRKAAKKAAPRKAAAKKAAPRKAAAKKATARKAAAKKATARKAAKKATARKAAAKKATPRKAAKKATPRKAAAKKATARKAAKKTTPRKAAAKKTTPRKAAAKKTTARKAAAKKAATRKK